jgi:hypothetical protein
MDYTPRERFRLNAIAVAHALMYALAVAAVAFFVSLVVGIAIGGGPVEVKTLLFVIGWLMMAYALVRLWPTNPTKVRVEEMDADDANVSDPEPDSSPDSIPAETTETRFQEAVYRLPPGRWLPRPAPSHRVRVEGKLFLGSVLVLLTSFLMETVLGIGVA